MILVDNEFEFGDIVYLKTCPEQFGRMVTGMTLRSDSMDYELSLGDLKSWHVPMEISKEKIII